MNNSQPSWKDDRQVWWGYWLHTSVYIPRVCASLQTLCLTFRGEHSDGNHVLVVTERNSQLAHPHCCLGCRSRLLFLQLSHLYFYGLQHQGHLWKGTTYYPLLDQGIAAVQCPSFAPSLQYTWRYTWEVLLWSHIPVVSSNHFWPISTLGAWRFKLCSNVCYFTTQNAL